MLAEHQQFHLVLTNALVEHKKLDQDQIVEIAEKFDIKVAKEDSSYEVVPKYAELFNKYRQKFRTGKDEE